MTGSPRDTGGDLLVAAQEAAARGWHVFPLHPESKRPACPDHRAADCQGPAGSDPWCHHGHTGWEQRATTDPGRIGRAWSSTQPGQQYGIGIACGPSQLVVVDLDQPKPGEENSDRCPNSGLANGAEALALLADTHHGEVPATWTVRTISGGTHLYYAAPPGVRLGNTAGSLGWLIDTRAHGGYVVAPPTAIAGHAYAVVDDRPPAPLPAWLAALLASPRRPSAASRPTRATASGERLSAYVRAAVIGETRKVTAAVPGTRNHTLFCAAVALGQLVAGGALDEHHAHDALAEACRAHLDADAFTPAEAEATIRSGLRTGARNPRSAA